MVFVDFMSPKSIELLIYTYTLYRYVQKSIGSHYNAMSISPANVFTISQWNRITHIFVNYNSYLNVENDKGVKYI